MGGRNGLVNQLRLVFQQFRCDREDGRPPSPTGRRRRQTALGTHQTVRTTEPRFSPLASALGDFGDSRRRRPQFWTPAISKLARAFRHVNREGYNNLSGYYVEKLVVHVGPGLVEVSFAVGISNSLPSATERRLIFNRQPIYPSDFFQDTLP